MTFQSIDPASGECLATFEEHSPGEVQGRLARACEAQLSWARRSPQERTPVLVRVAELLRERRDELALLATQEMGKPIAEARAEVEKCAVVCEYYAGIAPEALADREVVTDAKRSYVRATPFGLVLAIMPWNFPYWQVFRFAAPALAAGNGVLLKHAPSVTGVALEIEALFKGAGLPTGLMTALLIDEQRTGALIADPAVSAVTLTGSTRAGRSVAAAAGAALKKTVLELGGSDPYLILPDADLETALDACVTGRLLNAGQSCIAAKRLIVCEPLVEEFTQGLLKRFAAVTQGDPQDEATGLGPMARHDLRVALHAQVESSVAAGARLLLGGELPPGPGAFYPATLLDGVRPGMAAFDEELFGPVGVIVAARDEAEALELARRTTFGLGAAVFTTDLQRGERIAREELLAGAVFVNDFVRSDPRLPFGGFGDSGYGRELSLDGLREFAASKTIVVS